MQCTLLLRWSGAFLLCAHPQRHVFPARTPFFLMLLSWPRRARAAPLQFMLYNAVLRRWPAKDCERGNSYPSTIHVLVSAVMKLSQTTFFPEGALLYRGTGGRMALPAQFSRADRHGCRGFTEWGFMSTTSSKRVAIQYSGVREGRPLPKVLVVRVGAVDRGACIADFSQYPGERETLFVPLSFLEADGAERLEVTADGAVGLVSVRVNANLTGSILEVLEGRRKRAHLASFGFLVSDLGPALRRMAADGRAEERLSRDTYRVHHGVTHTVEGLVARIVSQVEEMRAEHERTGEEEYNRDAEYKRLVTAMLDAGTWAVSKLLLYLEDASRFMDDIMPMSLRDSHRARAAFLRKSMRALAPDGGARRAAALQLCQLQGLVVERIDERNAGGETPLDCAAAEGSAGRAAIALLIEAGAAFENGAALHKAAEHGHAEAVAALLDAKAPIESHSGVR